MLSNIKYILLTAQRDSLFFGLALAIAGAIGLGIFLGGTALVEEIETAVVYAAATSRIVLVIGLTVFTAFSIRRFFENREIDLMLVRPISRAKFLFSFLIGFSLIAMVLVIYTALILYLFAKPNFEGFAIWTLSIFLETILVLALTMAAAFILKSAVSSVLAVLAFYALSRITGFILVIVTAPIGLDFQQKFFKYFSAIIPRLDFFGKTEWIVYGVEDSSAISLFILQAAIYIPLLLSIALVDFKKKEF